MAGARPLFTSHARHASLTNKAAAAPYLENPPPQYLRYLPTHLRHITQLYRYRYPS